MRRLATPGGRALRRGSTLRGAGTVARAVRTVRAGHAELDEAGEEVARAGGDGHLAMGRRVIQDGAA